MLTFIRGNKLYIKLHRQTNRTHRAQVVHILWSFRVVVNIPTGGFVGRDGRGGRGPGKEGCLLGTPWAGLPPCLAWMLSSQGGPVPLAATQPTAGPARAAAPSCLWSSGCQWRRGAVSAATVKAPDARPLVAFCRRTLLPREVAQRPGKQVTG